MRSPTQVRSAQAPSTQAPATPAATNAEMARIDAQLELAAKKAALAGMEQAAAAGKAAGAAQGDADIAQFPPVPAVAGGRIVIERDGKTIVLENPTSEQLAQAGIGVPSQPDPKMIVSLTVATLGAIVLITWMVLNYLRRGRPSAAAAAPDKETAARMARIENAVESIAVEVERISEGQRYTSKMLSEGAAGPVPVPARGDAVYRSVGEA